MKKVFIHITIFLFFFFFSRGSEAQVKSSGILLLLAIGRSGMTGMKWSEDRTRLTKPGTKPTTIEVIKGVITIEGLIDAKRVSFEPLDGNGNYIFPELFS